MGPDLTGMYGKIGAVGVKAAIQPPYVGIMTAVFSNHAITPEEQADLLAFLEESVTPPSVTGSLTPEAPPGSPSRGELLFTGETHLHNGGPSCISCHSVSGLSFPGGGTLGPNLTHAYTKLGQRGTEAALQTLYFGVMAPIYGDRPLDPQEQGDLMAFLVRSNSQSQPREGTNVLVLLAFLLGIIFVALTGFIWRGRVRSVRRTLVDRAKRQGARS